MLPAVLSRVLMGAGARGAGGALAGAAGGAVAGVRGIASAFSTLADAASNDTEPKQEKRTQTNNVIIGNFGMAGQAAQAKITGGTNIAGTAKPANTNVSEKMPTEALLDTALKYLISIDKTLKTQLEFEKRSYDQFVKDQREAIIESKPTFNFSDIKDKLSGLKSNATEGAGLLGKGLLGLGVLGTAAALIAGSLDQTELDALKENVERFKNSFGWLGELGSMVGAGGVMGFLFGGPKFVGRLKGGLIGMAAAHVLERLSVHGLFGGGVETDENGNPVIDPQTGEPVRQSRAMSTGGYIAAAGLGVGAAVYGARKARGVRRAGANMAQLARATRATSVVGVQAATRRGTTWLGSRRGRIFLTILGRKLGRTMMGKLARHLARIVAGLLLTATGVGAIPGILMTLASVAFIAWDLYDVATSIWDAWNESEEAVTAQPAVTAAATTAPATPGDATRTAAPGVASTTGSPSPVTSTTANTNGQNKTVTGVVEGGRGYTTVRYSDGTIERRGGTLPARANNPGNIMYGDIARSYGAVGSSPSTNGPPVAVFPTEAEGFAAMNGLLTRNYSNGPIGQTIEAWATDPTHPSKVIGTAGIDPNKRYTDLTEDEKLRFMQALAKVEGFYAAGSGPTMRDGGLSSSSLASGVGGIVNAGLEEIGKLFGVLGSTIVPPGIARTFTPATSNVSRPVTSAPDRSERISTESANLHNDITFGLRSEESRRAIESPTMPATAPGVSRARGSISSMDPNYQSLNVLDRYLAHFRMAA